MPDATESAEYFDREYFELHEGKRRYLAYLVELVRRSGVYEGRVLDVGSGFGFFLEALAAAGYASLGVDASHEAARRSRERGVSTVVADAGAPLPLRAESFAAVTLLDVIEHVARDAPLLAESRRVLRPGGKVFVITLNAGSLARPILGRSWSFHLDPTHRTLYSKRSLAEAVRAAGFRLERITTLSNLCSVGEGNPWLKPLRRIGRVVLTPWLGDSLLAIGVRD